MIVQGIKFDLRFGIVKSVVSVFGSLLLVYLVSAFFCSAPPCFTKKNEFLLTVFMSNQSWFFLGLWALLFLIWYGAWSWGQGKKE